MKIILQIELIGWLNLLSLYIVTIYSCYLTEKKNFAKKRVIPEMKLKNTDIEKKIRLSNREVARRVFVSGYCVQLTINCKEEEKVNDRKITSSISRESVYYSF